MPIQIVSREHFSLICEMFESADASIKIISPFIGLDMAQMLANNMACNPSLEVEIITRFYRADFIKGVSRIAALEKLYGAGAKIYALLGLHTKLYLFGEDVALLGSANFTSGGFKINHELSLCVKDENEVNPHLVIYFNDLVSAINQSGNYLLTAEKIAEEKYLVESAIKSKRNKNTEYRNDAMFGANINMSSQADDTDQSDTIQSILSAKSPTENSEVLLNEYIIMRLSISPDNQGRMYDGEETIQAYMADQKIRDYTWYSTNALHAGMAIEKVKEFNDAINNGKNVSILFAIGKSSGGINEIAYKANVLEVRSSRQPEPLPTNDYPVIWHGKKATIWLKINNIQRETVLKANMFKFSKNGEDLQKVIIGKNRFSFGYISYK
ncbi:MAG: phospholipase D family protein [Oscillospiraceae bacterium]|nr:phospholipase D family protein [Oscillospiraceae bacterium]